MTIRIALLAAECEPWAKVGGLADVVDALARAIGRLPEAQDGEIGLPVDVFLPRYRVVEVPRDAAIEPPLVIADPADGSQVVVSIANVTAGGYRARLVDYPPAFDRVGIYEHPDDAWRFALFCRAAIAALRRDGTPLDLLHLHDWHAAPAILDRVRAEAAGDAWLANTAVLLTLHNLAYHGWTPLDKVGQLGLPPADPLIGHADGIDLLRVAIEGADLVNTVSPGFAAEALTPEFGMGLDGTLRELGDRFSGILNGIDPAVWNPAADAALAAPYARGDLAGKAACRADLLVALGFDARDDGPVLGMIGRLDGQKGFDLLADGARELLAAGARLVVLGTGNPAIADPLRALATELPAHVALIERFDRDLARRVYAGADLFLMPSRFEPCGQGQMIALRYGTPPVVRRTGGLADSVIDLDERPGAGTGFQFDDPTPEAFVAVCLRAMHVRSAEPARWAALVDRGMAADFCWDTSSAPQYLAAYHRAISLRRASRGSPA